jgi:hypothetical protein
LRRWIGKIQPVPKTVIGEMPDGVKKKIAIGVGRYKYQEAVNALTSARVVTAFNGEGEQQASIEMDEAEAAAFEALEEQVSERRDVETFRAILATELPALIDKIAQRFESGFTRAYEAGTASNRAAFDSLVGVVKAQGQLASGSIRDQFSLLKSLREAYTANGEAAAAGAGDPMDGIMLQLLMGGQNANLGDIISKMDPATLAAIMAKMQGAASSPPKPPNGANGHA